MTVEKELKERGLRMWAETASATDDGRAWKERACSTTFHQENMEDDENDPYDIVAKDTQPLPPSTLIETLHY